MNPPRRDEDNKPWPVWLKTLCGVVLAVAGFGAGWCTWVTSNIYAAQIVAVQVDDLTEAVHEHTVQISNLPPPEWKERIKAIEADMRQNQSDHLAILVALEQIKVKLGVEPVK